MHSLLTQIESFEHNSGALVLGRWLFLGFVVASAYTHPINEYGTSAILGRMVWADVFGLATVVMAFLALRPQFNLLATGAIIYVFSMVPGVAFSGSAILTIVEICVHFFLVLLFVSACEIITTRRDFVQLLRVFALTTLFAAVLGIWENTTFLTNLPSLFPEDERGFRAATFRNSGQAGAFYLVSLATLVPLRYGRLIKNVSSFDRRLIEFAIILSLICMIMSVKIAALIGCAIGFGGFAVYKRKIGFVIPLILVVFFFQTQSEWLADQFPVLANRIEYKTRTRLNTEAVTSSDGFIGENYRLAFKAFEDNPLCGSGIMGFHGVYSRHEVHSTPMKLVGETGMLGCIGYAVFVVVFVQVFFVFKKFPRWNVYREYLELMLPFLVGCGVSWIYTYHMRKREFWILMVVVFVTVRLMHVTDEEEAIEDSCEYDQFDEFGDSY